METPTPAFARNPLTWDPLALRLTPRYASFAAFAAVYGALVFVGYGLRENFEQLTIVWPAAGLLVMVLWFAPTRNWIWILAIQLLTEIAIDYARAPQFQVGWSALFASADSLDAIVGAWFIRRWIAQPTLPRITQVSQFLLAVALGAAASAMIGAYGSVNTVAGPGYWREWQLWWAGNWLGSLCIAPVVLMWSVRFRRPELSIQRTPIAELLIISTALLGLTYWVFSVSHGVATSILDMPFVLLAVLVVAAFRLPPRWTAVLTAFATLTIAYYASRHSGPFSAYPSAFARIGAVQIYMATLICVSCMMSVVLMQMRSTIAALTISDQRYRNFVQNSSEAVWRIELDRSMPVDLPLEDQKGWLKRHAYIAECNLHYRLLDDSIATTTQHDYRVFRAEVPWSALYLEHFEKAANHLFSMDGLQFSLPIAGQAKTYMAAFSGVIDDGALQRIWGVARDVTELVELTERLRRNRDRLQSYASQLTGAEDRARRTIAVDLHDGIGQQLMGLGMTLAAAAARAPNDVRLLLDEAQQVLRDIHATTQRVIAELSPPGLYELGIEPALKWLSVLMRGQDGLQVDMTILVNDSAFDLELRILVFKVIRELLRNVAKHSHVKNATLTVQQTARELRVEVSDSGVGFEWQLDLFESRARGFGLWSVVDRVRGVMGDITVDTAPGKGCRVLVVFPINSSQSLHSISQPELGNLSARAN